MNKQDYKQKRRECWEEAVLHGALEVDKDLLFDHAFKCGYALGREKEIITQEDIERAAEKHADELKVSSTVPGVMVPMLHDIAKSSYICGAQDTLGKQEKDTVIQGWVARDGNNDLNLYFQKPIRNRYSPYWAGLGIGINFSKESFPDLTWDSDPIEVELIIKRKKK